MDAPEVERAEVERFARAVDGPLRELELQRHPGSRWERNRLYVAFHAQMTKLLVERHMDTDGTSIELEHFAPDFVSYAPSSWLPMGWALRHVRPTPGDVFVEFGCGRGRVVCEAARRPFARVIGVEISPRLVEAARVNVERNRRRFACQDVELVTADAAEWRIPDDMTVGYLNYPFVGATFRRVVDNVVASLAGNPRRMRLVYLSPAPALENYILDTGCFRVVKRRRGRGDRGRIINSVSLYEHTVAP